MDDHVYTIIRDYAEADLLPTFRAEYETSGRLEDCESYEEVKALCRALNIIAPYAGYERVTPKDFVE